MQNKLQKIFKKKNKIVIGALHFSHLLGYPKFAGFKKILKDAVSDLRALENGGVDGIILENNYGLSPEFVDTPVAISMGYLIGEIKKMTKLSLGVDVLWNDYKTAFALAKTYDLQFIRVPVFVDTVKPYCGKIVGDAKKVLETRKMLGAESVAIFADIHVKHAKLLSKDSLSVSAKKAVKAGADAVIVTGTWTGKKPSEEDLIIVRKAIGNHSIMVGSGADKDNISDLFKIADGVIVSTSLKKGGVKKGVRNVKSHTQRLDVKKVKEFMTKVKK
ncbi:MAG: hypothetical protein A3G52_04535 [Candidatus Taylorbacteria bacterium RIFCSPLOWO2_12_FULL_43_20]|uniref:Photosystem I assembly BtpA n=1 Tax=Candidatus Taylorbacteria bacterium RIFCSPLOWO2_12_FULL_43_20 TaxID=1802332 RepID=A0A1G2NZ06_9BACT|nr:MAG: hypothetical protein A2825_00485 [Candidatus Taylorbacteria bacterium RIFCSPHIGHO2_01_FULL_43_120]OHA24014.1 MAG: hypothetical protein A3B98_00955 [Candidatus Taylorbacteria bacterium RIFCSPHIGHO2_02_FULL_43_55]OHA30469.1 MAG: hypothetical protein A3E92_02255 [Candidatus Taylorbacteria bacterium RIFCSPHIGHO2_12_FULL_42_34]OHA32133.1 MAG: hypothetical protein A3B09_00100 [Candidatus Taylorbacteria bacterium RIFCSPLOWO2_01_FULL_43_83]OHA39922.1 MAG: hypothetical protein A3H58_02270 [Candi